MGQVLIIQNKIDGEPINTIYYHWSAYTESSIAELDGFANSLSHKYHNRRLRKILRWIFASRILERKFYDRTKRTHISRINR